MDETAKFAELVQGNIARMADDRDFYGLSNIWIRESIRHKYAQNFSWLGRPVIQVPQDLYAIQEIIWQVKPDLVIETGIAHGGSLVMSASMLALLHQPRAIQFLQMKGQRGRRYIQRIANLAHWNAFRPRLDQQAVDRKARLLREGREGGHGICNFHISRLLELCAWVKRQVYPSNRNARDRAPL